MQHILLPTDFSDNSLNAALYAMDLFLQNVHQYTVINCYSLPAYGDSAMVDVTEHLQYASQEGLDDFQLRLLKVLPNKDLRVDFISEHGRLERVVHKYGRRVNGPELIVMGTQGASVMKAVFMGTNTADVIKHSALPVLAIPEQARFTGLKRIVLADDGGEVDPKVLDILIQIVMHTNAELIVTRVVNENTKVEDPAQTKGIATALRNVPHTTVHLSGDDIMHELNEEVVRSNADLLALVHRERGIFDRLFHRSIASNIVMHTRTPMLVLQSGI